MELNIDQLRALADLAHEKHLAEIQVQQGDERITIKTPAAFVQQATVLAPGSVGATGSGFMLPPLPQAVTSSFNATLPVQSSNTSAVTLTEPAEGQSSAHQVVVTAPMVGTFYRSPSPESPPFADVGQLVRMGQPLCIIEAMKLMNELESDVEGTVVAVLTENGTPVEFGQRLFIIERAP